MQLRITPLHPDARLSGVGAQLACALAAGLGGAGARKVRPYDGGVQVERETADLAMPPWFA
jgi:hypothetical protein